MSSFEFLFSKSESKSCVDVKINVETRNAVGKYNKPFFVSDPLKVVWLVSPFGLNR